MPSFTFPKSIRAVRDLHMIECPSWSPGGINIADLPHLMTPD